MPRFKRFLQGNILLAALFCTTATHALTDRDHLEKWCTHGSSVAAGRCIGYLLAAEDALSLDSIEGIRACLPQDVALSEQHRVVVEWLNAHRAAEAATALGLVARAYAERYPCGK